MDDFDRNVWCLLGLPLDAIDLETTVHKIHQAAKNKSACFISTPNLNFLIASQTDEKFRDSVINSDLSIADGKPLIWLARILGIPLPERVAGSDLIEALIENKKGYKPLKVFFFGGQEGIAQQACEKLNSQDKGLQCVGFYNPGFGSIEDMSSTEIIEKINHTNADFIIVSLGAKKGQAWIEYNKDKLDAPIISHLGAVVNFVAGNVKRAPKIYRRIGLEWLWRIKEEPLLWKRYMSDGLALIYLLFSKVFPYYFLIQGMNKEKNNRKNVNVLKNNGVTTISLDGDFVTDNVSDLNEVYRNILKSPCDVRFVIENESRINIGSAFIAKTIIFRKHLLKTNKTMLIQFKSKQLSKVFYYNCCEYLIEN